MKRRTFIAALGGAAAWPVLARAEAERVRRVGVLLPGFGVDDADLRAGYAAFVEALQQLGRPAAPLESSDRNNLMHRSGTSS